MPGNRRFGKNKRMRITLWPINRDKVKIISAHKLSTQAFLLAINLYYSIYDISIISSSRKMPNDVYTDIYDVIKYTFCFIILSMETPGSGSDHAHFIFYAGIPVMSVYFLRSQARGYASLIYTM